MKEYPLSYDATLRHVHQATLNVSKPKHVTPTSPRGGTRIVVLGAH